MKRLVIEGNRPLKGTIEISGAKNSAVALLPATLLCDDISEITNVPNVSDIDNLKEIMTFLGAKFTQDNDTVKIDSSHIRNKEIKEEMCNKLRASYYFMGVLLGRFKEVSIYFPGGCALGTRPIDQHIKGFLAMGATITIDNNKYILKADKLIGNKIVFDKSSVGATINILFAAVKAEGLTTIINAAKEPEIVNVADFLNSMGAKIEGAGTDRITITGVEHLHQGRIQVIPDRIEAGTYIIMATAIGKDITIKPIIRDHNEMLISKLEEMGAEITINDLECRVKRTEHLKPVSIITLPFPGFPTDLQQPIMILLTQCHGNSFIEETIYDRFKQVDYLNKMGARIVVNSPKAYVSGKTSLRGEEVLATDLRAGAALVIAALIADGKTIINDVSHILRGYDKIIEKLTSVGAKIKLEEI